MKHPTFTMAHSAHPERVVEKCWLPYCKTGAHMPHTTTAREHRRLGAKYNPNIYPQGTPGRH